MQKFCFVLFLGIFIFTAQAFADDLKDPYNEILLNKIDSKEDQQDDPFFTGITVKNGNTTIQSGTESGVDPATVHGGFSPEVLPYLKRSVAYVSSGDASVSTSETHSSDWQETHAETEAHLDSHITISKRE